MSHLAITAPLSTFAAEELALCLARDAEGFRAAHDDGTLLSALLAEVVNALPPTCLDKVRPALCRAGRTVAAALRLRLCAQLIPFLDWHCTVALRKPLKLLVSGNVVQLVLSESTKKLVASHLAYAQAEVCACVSVVCLLATQHDSSRTMMNSVVCLLEIQHDSSSRSQRLRLLRNWRRRRLARPLTWRRGHCRPRSAARAQPATRS